jgi:hypothetical protein
VINAINFTLLGGLAIGFFWVLPAFGENWHSYVPPFLLVFILMAITFALLRRRQFYNVAVISVIMLFWFAYFIRFFLIVAHPGSVYFLVPKIAWSSFDNPGILQTSFIYLSAAFCTFCVSVIFFSLTLGCRMERRIAIRNARVKVNERTPSGMFVMLAILALVFLNFIYLSYGIGMMGEFVENPLPFKLTGAIVYTKSVIVPCLLVLHIYWAQKSGRFVWARLGVLVLFLSGIFDMYVYKSRGALLFQTFPLGLVWLLAGFNLYKFDKLILVLVLTGTFLFIPIVTALRFNSALELVPINQIVDGINFIFFRITGIDQFMVILNLGEPISIDNLWSVLSSPRGIAGYYTTQLLNYAEHIPQTFAPSMLGCLYLVGGLPGILAGVIFLGFLATYMWNIFGLFYPKCAPVVKSYFLVFLLLSITEGIAQGIIISFIIAAVLLWFMEKHFLIWKNPRPDLKINDVTLGQA